MRLRSSRRPGLSLLEVIISLAVFLMSLAGLGYLMTNSGEMAYDGSNRSRMVYLAESKLAELQAGAIPLQNESDAEFEEAPEYTYSIEVQPGPATNLSSVNLRVSHKRPNNTTLEVVFTRLILDPKYVGSTQDTVESLSTGTPEGTETDPSGSAGSGGAAGSAAGGGATPAGGKSSGASSGNKGGMAPSGGKGSGMAPSGGKGSTGSGMAPSGSKGTTGGGSSGSSGTGGSSSGSSGGKSGGAPSGSSSGDRGSSKGG